MLMIQKIDRTFHRLIRSLGNSEVANNSHNSSAFASAFAILKFDNVDFNYNITNSNSNLGICISNFSQDYMADNNRTLKELVTPDIMYQPWCIRYPELEQAQSYELKSRLIHLLPKFHGIAGGDPHKQLKESHGNTQQFGVKGSTASEVVNGVVIGQHHISPLVRVCGICAFVEHPTNACPTLQ
ncbi:hypothetical protein CR513_42991, partial [Mucuna pruriens]